MPGDREQEERQERWLSALAELPRPELSLGRQAEIKVAMRAALSSKRASLSTRWYGLFERCVEPAMVIMCTGAVLVRVGMLIARYFSA